MHVQPFVADGAVIALDIGILLRFVWLDVFEFDALGLCPGLKRLTDLFRLIVHADGLGLVAPLNDLF